MSTAPHFLGEQSTVLRKSSTINGSLFVLWEEFSPLSPISYVFHLTILDNHWWRMHILLGNRRFLQCKKGTHLLGEGFQRLDGSYLHPRILYRLKISCKALCPTVQSARRLQYALITIVAGAHRYSSTLESLMAMSIEAMRQLCQSPLHPQDLEGRYSLRLLFNGAHRRESAFILFTRRQY